MEIEVFLYEWTYWDPETDSNVTRQPPYLVTKACFDQRVEANPSVLRRIIPESVISVPINSVVDGVHHPNLIRSGFQIEVLPFPRPR